MDNLQFRIAQGSTPSLELGLPFEADVDDVVFVTFTQSDRNVLEYGMNGTPSVLIAGAGELSIDDDDPSIMVLTMTQADTFKLTPGDAELQLRILTVDGADTFFPLVGEIIKANKTGVIT